MDGDSMMKVLETLGKLFSEHTPETLMALFGAATSLLLFYLIWYLLRQLLGQLNRNVGQEVEQDQASSELVETLIGELLAEAEHLRRNLQGVLEITLKRGEENAQSLTTLIGKSEAMPMEILELLKPEFDHLQQEMRSAEGRITAKIVEMVSAGGSSEGQKEHWEEVDISTSK